MIGTWCKMNKVHSACKQLISHQSVWPHMHTCKSNVCLTWLFNGACCLFRFITFIVGTTTAELQARGSHSNNQNGEKQRIANRLNMQETNPIKDMGEYHSGNGGLLSQANAFKINVWGVKWLFLFCKTGFRFTPTLNSLHRGDTCHKTEVQRREKIL